MAERTEWTDEDEIARIMSLTDEEVSAELRAEGVDPDAAAARMREELLALLAEYEARRAGKLSGEGHD
jgi:hypothetical protein